MMSYCLEFRTSGSKLGNPNFLDAFGEEFSLRILFALHLTVHFRCFFRIFASLPLISFSLLISFADLSVPFRLQSLGLLVALAIVVLEFLDQKSTQLVIPTWSIQQRLSCHLASKQLSSKCHNQLKCALFGNQNQLFGDKNVCSNLFSLVVYGDGWVLVHLARALRLEFSFGAVGQSPEDFSSSAIGTLALHAVSSSRRL